MPLCYKVRCECAVNGMLMSAFFDTVNFFLNSGHILDYIMNDSEENKAQGICTSQVKLDNLTISLNKRQFSEKPITCCIAHIF